MHLAAESHVDRSIDAPADFVTTNVVGTYTLLEAALAHGASAARAAARISASTTSRPTKCLARSAMTSRFTEDDALRSALALFRHQGCVRSSGPRLAPHLRPAGRAYQLLEQLRARTSSSRS